EPAGGPKGLPLFFSALFRRPLRRNRSRERSAARSSRPVKASSPPFPPVPRTQPSTPFSFPAAHWGATFDVDVAALRQHSRRRRDPLARHARTRGRRRGDGRERAPHTEPPRGHLLSLAGRAVRQQHAGERGLARRDALGLRPRRLAERDGISPER